MKNNNISPNFDMYNAGAQVFTLISKISWRYKKAWGIVGDSYDLTANEVALLAIIDQYEGVDTAHLLRRELGITKGMVSRYVDNLLKKGLLKAVTDEKDKRIIRLSLSEEAVKISHRVTELGTDFVIAAFDGVEPDSIRIMVETLNRIYANLGDLSEV